LSHSRGGAREEERKKNPYCPGRPLEQFLTKEFYRAEKKESGRRLHYRAGFLLYGRATGEQRHKRVKKGKQTDGYDLGELFG